MTREETILDRLPQVHLLARNLRKRIPLFLKSVRLEDLVSDGTLGMIKAVDSFDPNQRVLLATHAERRINGEMMDGLRSRGDHRKGGPEYHFFDVSSMSGTLRDPRPDPETLAIRNQVRRRLLQLSQRHRTVLTMYYLDQKPEKEIAAKMGLHHTSIAKLKKSAAMKLAA